MSRHCLVLDERIRWLAIECLMQKRTDCPIPSSGRRQRKRSFVRFSQNWTRNTASCCLSMAPGRYKLRLTDRDSISDVKNAEIGTLSSVLLAGKPTNYLFQQRQSKNSRREARSVSRGISVSERRNGGSRRFWQHRCEQPESPLGYNRELLGLRYLLTVTGPFIPASTRVGLSGCLQTAR